MAKISKVNGPSIRRAELLPPRPISTEEVSKSVGTDSLVSTESKGKSEELEKPSAPKLAQTTEPPSNQDMTEAEFFDVHSMDGNGLETEPLKSSSKSRKTTSKRRTTK